MKIKKRILSGLCAVLSAFGMSKTKSDAKIISYCVDQSLELGLVFGLLVFFDCQVWEDIESKQKVPWSFVSFVNVLGLVGFVNGLVDVKYVQNLEAELQELKNPDKKLNQQKKIDGKNEKLNNSTNGEKKG